jgi:NTE family protein
MTGMAFSGGGARGIAHLGVLKAFKEEGIVPDIIAGTSAGAIVGAFQAAGISPDEALEVIIKTKLLAIFKPAFSRRGLLSIAKLGKILAQYLPGQFAQLNTPLAVAATDIQAGKTRYFDSGELVLAIMASSCIPVVFSPVEIDGTLYVDGGLLNNLPAEPIRAQVNRLIGVSCNPYTYNADLKNVRSLMERSALLAINGNTVKSKELCDLVIEPPDLSRFSGFDLTNAREIFAEGYNFTQQNMAIFASRLT